MKSLTQIALLAGLASLGAVGTHFFHPQAPAWYLQEIEPAEGELTATQIHHQWNDDVLWIDARSLEDFEKGHLPQAIHLPESDVDEALFQHMEALQTNTKPVVIYCSSQSCKASHRLRDYLMARIAMDQVYVLQGGWESWQEHQQSHAH